MNDAFGTLDEQQSFPSEPTVRDGVHPIRTEYLPDATEPTMRGAIGPRPARPAPGDDLLGRYTVLEELGEGGMGVVYKCLDREGGIEVAIKCLPPEVTRNRDELEEIRENYQIVARLHHSSISGLRNLERDSASGDYYVVMDLAEGEDLSRILRRRRGRPMSLHEALDILRPVAAALDYAHGEGVLHRDVKPANVKVEALGWESRAEMQRRREGGASSPSEPTTTALPNYRTTAPNLRVQLLDFGLAAQVRSSMSRVSLRGHAGSSGTPTYMAPEQWEARRQSAATDQYALAVMAYEMLAGAPPFSADDGEILKSAVLSRNPDSVDGLPESANAALQRALAKNPKDRFASCSEFVAALSGASTPCEPQKKSGKGWLVAALLALVVDGGIWFAVGKNGGESSPSEPKLGGATSPLPAPPPVEARASSPNDAEIETWINSRTKNDAKGVSLPSYEIKRNATLLRTKIYDAWMPPPRSASGKRPAVIVFEISRDGQLIEPHVKTSSGSTAFDNSCLDAVRSVGKIDGLSDEFIREYGSACPFKFKSLE